MDGGSRKIISLCIGRCLASPMAPGPQENVSDVAYGMPRHWLEAARHRRVDDCFGSEGDDDDEYIYKRKAK